MPRHQVQFVTCPSGDTVTEPFAVSGVHEIGFLIPTYTSAQIFLQGSFDTTSANFARTYLPEATGQHGWNLGGNPGCIYMRGNAFPYMKIEFSVAQTAVRSIAVLTKP